MPLMRVLQVLSDAAVLKRQAREIEELRRVLAANGGGCALRLSFFLLYASPLVSSTHVSLQCHSLLPACRGMPGGMLALAATCYVAALFASAALGCTRVIY